MDKPKRIYEIRIMESGMQINYIVENGRYYKIGLWSTMEAALEAVRKEEIYRNEQDAREQTNRR